MSDSLFRLAEKVELYLGKLHNIAAHVQINSARTIWLEAHRSFQTARCEVRRRRADRLRTQLLTLAKASDELCTLAAQHKDFQEVCAEARQAINAFRAALGD